MSVDDRAARRLLAFLARGAGRVREAAGGGKLLISAGERGTIGAAREAVAALAQSGLVRRSGDTIELTPSGAERLAGDSTAGEAGAPRRPTGRRMVEIDGAWRPALVNHAESPLAALARRKTRAGDPYLSRREFEAGERLRSDYTRGRIMTRLGVNWDSVGRSDASGHRAGGIGDLTDAALAARQRVTRAVEAVGPELSGVLIDICCFLKGLEQVEAERGWPCRSAKIMLKSALAALARHYAPPPGQPSRDRHPILHWGGDGYKPRWPGQAA